MIKPIIGIDPGKNGGIAALTAHDEYLLNVMPETIEEKIKLIKYLKQAIGAETVCIEKVGYRPGDGGSSAFLFGRQTGELIGISKAFGLEVIEVHPRTWQCKFFDKEDKRPSKMKSLEYARFVLGIPERKLYASKRSKNLHDGIADAACIANYGSLYGDLKL